MEDNIATTYNGGVIVFKGRSFSLFALNEVCV